jgi:hypothetical protein
MLRRLIILHAHLQKKSIPTNIKLDEQTNKIIKHANFMWKSAIYFGTFAGGIFGTIKCVHSPSNSNWYLTLPSFIVNGMVIGGVLGFMSPILIPGYIVGSVVKFHRGPIN